MPFQPFARDWDRVHAVLDAEQWNWLAVEITEIRRCASVGDQAHDRLALLLIDHLVEVVVGREVNAQLSRQLPDSVVKEMREARENGAFPETALDTAIDEHIGPEQRKRIDDHLHEKTKYLVKRKVLTPQERDVLDRLHEYRNAAYHRETLEAGLISDLVLAYMVLAGQLLARHEPGMWIMATSKPVAVVSHHELPDLLTEGLDMDLKAMAGRFSDHAMKRVENIASAAATATLLLHVSGSDVPSPDDEFGCLLVTLRDTNPKLRSWRKRASGLRGKTASLVGLMLPFIGLDRDLSPVEPSVRRLEMIRDYVEQQHLDDVRGK